MRLRAPNGGSSSDNDEEATDDERNSAADSRPEDESRTNYLTEDQAEEKAQEAVDEGRTATKADDGGESRNPIEDPSNPVNQRISTPNYQLTADGEAPEPQRSSRAGLEIEGGRTGERARELQQEVLEQNPGLDSPGDVRVIESADGQRMRVALTPSGERSQERYRRDQVRDDVLGQYEELTSDDDVSVRWAEEGEYDVEFTAQGRARLEGRYLTPEGEGIRIGPSEETLRDRQASDIREDIASEYDAYDARDIELDVEDGIVTDARVTERARYEQAADRIAREEDNLSQDDVSPVYTGDGYQIELSDEAQRRRLRQRVEDEHPDREFEIVEQEGEFVAEFEPQPEERDSQVGQWLADRSHEWQQGAEDVGDWIDETVPGGSVQAPILSPGTARHLGTGSVDTGVDTGAAAGAAARESIKIVDPAGGALLAGDTVSFAIDEERALQQARIDAREELQGMDWEEFRDNPERVARLTAESGPLPPEHTAGRLQSGADVATQSATEAGGSFASDPWMTTFGGVGAVAGATVIPSGAARGVGRVARGASGGAGRVRSAIPDSRTRDVLSEARVQTPNIRVVRDADAPVVDVASGVGRNLDEVSSSLRPSTPEYLSREAMSARVGSAAEDVRGTVQGGSLSAEAAVVRTQERARSTLDRSPRSELAGRIEDARMDVSEEIQGLYQSAALEAERQAFRARQGVDRTREALASAPGELRASARPDLDLAERISDYRAGVAEDLQWRYKSAALEAERQAFRARQGVDRTREVISDAPDRLRSMGDGPDLAGRIDEYRTEIVDEGRGLYQSAALEAERQAFRARQGAESVRDRVTDLDPRGVDVSPGNAMRGAALEAEGAAYNVRQRAGRTLESVEETAASARRFPREVSVRVEPGRPPRQERVLDVRDADIDVVSEAGEAIDVPPSASGASAADEGRISSGGGGGQQAVARLDEPSTTDVGPMARDGLDMSPVDVVGPAGAAATGVFAESESADVSPDMSVDEVSSPSVAAGSVFDVDNQAMIDEDAGTTALGDDLSVETAVDTGTVETARLDSPLRTPQETVPQTETPTMLDTPGGRPPRRGPRPRPFWPSDEDDDGDLGMGDVESDDDDIDNPVSETPFEDMDAKLGSLEEGW